jgi:hypothetical protein
MSEQDENKDQQDQGDAATTDTGGESGHSGTSTVQGNDFTPAQQALLNKRLQDEKRNTLRVFKESDEYKNLVSRAQQANEADELRAKVQRLEQDKQGAAARYENILTTAQLRSEAMRRGMPPERIDMAMLVIDKSNVKVDWNTGSVTGAEDAVQEFVEGNPWFVGSGVAPQQTTAPRPAPNLNGGNRGTSATEESKIQSVMDEMAARGLGRI